MLSKQHQYDRIMSGSTETVGGSPLRGIFYHRTSTPKRSDAVMRVGNKTKGLHMLTLEGLIAVISLCATMFALGYAVGHDNK
jgi:hypothetical protein